MSIIWGIVMYYFVNIIFRLVPIVLLIVFLYFLYLGYILHRAKHIFMTIDVYFHNLTNNYIPNTFTSLAISSNFITNVKGESKK